MAETISRARLQIPSTFKLDGGQAVTLRMMSATDADRILAFARALPERDLLFLRVDITRPEVVQQWVENLASGRTTTVLADSNGAVAGYASLHHNTVTWQRHLGEIRLQAAQGFRGQGLGRELAAAIFDIAGNMGLRKVIAQMTADQKSAVATFRRLGFQIEALLQDFAIDRAGQTHDLIVMTYDVANLTDSTG